MTIHLRRSKLTMWKKMSEVCYLWGQGDNGLREVREERGGATDSQVLNFGQGHITGT